MRVWDLILPGWRWLQESSRSAIIQWGVGVSTPCRAVSIRGTTVFVPGASDLRMDGRTSDPGIELILGRRWLHEPQPISNQPVGLGFPHHAGRYWLGGPPFSFPAMGITKKVIRMVGLLELQVYGRISNPGVGPYPPQVALAHAASMDGKIPVPYQSSRKSQQPLAWIWPTGTIIIGQ